MKLSLFLGCVLLSILVVASGHTFDSRLDEDWKIWKSQHEKQYTEEEETHRRSIWEDNVRYIEQHNLEYSMGKHTFTVGMNEFGDLTNKEFDGRMNGFVPIEAVDLTEEEIDERDVFDEDNIRNHDLREAAFDWRDKGVVTPVKKQGNCHSSWAFSVTGAMEGQWARKIHKLISLSEQNLIDCTRPFGNNGCQRGSMTQAFQYVVQNKGINSEQSYPYTGQEGICKFQRVNIAARIKGHNFIQKNEKALARAVREIGPIAVAVDANHGSFCLYKGGIYYEKSCSEHVSHAMLVVGYGRENGKSYWLVKNSWGTRWGEQGYIKMAKDMGNNCGIANYAVYPIV